MCCGTKRIPLTKEEVEKMYRNAKEQDEFLERASLRSQTVDKDLKKESEEILTFWRTLERVVCNSPSRTSIIITGTLSTIAGTISSIIFPIIGLIIVTVAIAVFTTLSIVWISLDAKLMMNSYNSKVRAIASRIKAA